MDDSNSKFKLLIVDDEKGILNYLGICLKEDYHLIQASSGEDALVILSEPKHSDIALILTDERMPGISGSELLLKSVETHPLAVRWLITAWPVGNLSIYKKESHIDSYIEKSIWEFEGIKMEVRKATRIYGQRIKDKEKNV